MPANGTAQLSAQVQPLYDKDFYIAGQSYSVFDQLTDFKGPIMNGERGSSQNFPIVESLAPNTAALDELSDLTPALMNVNQVVITLAEYGGAVQLTKFLTATAYPDVHKQAAFVNGYNLAESIDLIVRATCGQGSRVIYQNAQTARSGFAGISTAGDRLSAAFINKLGLFASSMGMALFDDGTVVAVMQNFPYSDLLADSDVKTMSQYSVPEMLFNAEVGYWGGVRMIKAKGAKVFWGAGATAASSLATTLAAPSAVGATNIKLTSVTNLAVGQILSVLDNGKETGNSWTDTSEGFYVTTVGTGGASGTGVTGFPIGGSSNGGLRYAHNSGIVANNGNSVYPITVLGPNSISKAASDQTGPYGMSLITGPFDIAGRFQNVVWYLIAGWNRTREEWLLRGECGSSFS